MVGHLHRWPEPIPALVWLASLSLLGCGGSNSDSQVQEILITPAPTAFSNVVVVGDSIGAASRAQNAYPYYLVVPDYVDNQALAGTKLAVEITATFTANLDLSPLADGVIIQGGVNDLRQWDESSPVYDDQLQLMRQTVVTMTSEAYSRGLRAMLISLTPWQGDTKWTPLKQQLTTDYNAWLLTYATQTGALFVDAYTTLLDTSGATQGMDVLLGGPLHPNFDGAMAIAAAADDKILLLRRY